MSTTNAGDTKELQEQSTWYTDTSGGQAWGKTFTNTLELVNCVYNSYQIKLVLYQCTSKFPQVPFADCAVDTIGLLPTTSKGNKYMLTFMCLVTSYLIAVPRKSKTAEEVTMAYIKHI